MLMQEERIAEPCKQNTSDELAERDKKVACALSKYYHNRYIGRVDCPADQDYI